jgi:steroid delta-isomerase-like uncharacterized protein
MYTRRDIMLMTAIGLLVLCAPAAAQTEANKALMRRVLEEAYNQGNLDVIDEVMAADYTWPMGNPQVRSSEEFKQHVAEVRTNFPDIHVTVEDQVAEGDRVVTRWTIVLTPQVTMTGILISIIADGKIAGDWENYDELGLMEQLGVMPATREDYTWGEPSTVTGDPGDPETNKALLQRLFDEAFKGNLDIIDELMATDYVFHDPVSPVEVHGPEGYKQEFGMYLTAFPDIQITFEQMIAEDDKVVIRWTLSGTHEGELMGIPPTGRRVAVRGISMYRVADGKFVETWPSYDALGMIQQLTAEEWSVDGPWIVTVPTPMGNMIIKGIWTAQDAAQTRLSGEFEQINVYPLLIDLYPDSERVKFAGALAVKTGLNQYDMTAIEYFTKTVGPGHEEIVGLGVVSGNLELTGPDSVQGQGTGAYYLPSQDADQDGFPDEGQEPALCVPWTWTGKRLTLMPPCVPTPPAE